MDDFHIFEFGTVQSDWPFFLAIVISTGAIFYPEHRILCLGLAFLMFSIYMLRSFFYKYYLSYNSGGMQIKVNQRSFDRIIFKEVEDYALLEGMLSIKTKKEHFKYDLTGVSMIDQNLVLNVLDDNVKQF